LERYIKRSYNNDKAFFDKIPQLHGHEPNRLIRLFILNSSLFSALRFVSSRWAYGKNWVYIKPVHSQGRDPSQTFERFHSSNSSIYTLYSGIQWFRKFPHVAPIWDFHPFFEGLKSSLHPSSLVSFVFIWNTTWAT